MQEKTIKNPANLVGWIILVPSGNWMAFGDSKKENIILEDLIQWLSVVLKSELTLWFVSSWVRLSSYDCVVRIPAQTPLWFAYTRKENPQSGFQDVYKVFPNFLSNYWIYFPLVFNVPARMLSIPEYCWVTDCPFVSISPCHPPAPLIKMKVTFSFTEINYTLHLHILWHLMFWTILQLLS